MSSSDDARTELAASPLTGRLRAAAAETYLAIRAHPFLTGLVDGGLDRACFQFYIVQDGHYLRGFARSLALLAARAPSEAVTGLLARHTTSVITVERSLHASLLVELAASIGDPPNSGVAPVTLAYSSYVTATCATGAFSDGIASVLPCYWIYRDVGQALLAQSSPDPLYAQWIETYADEEFARAVQEMLELTDFIGAALSERDQQSAIDHFATTARYEWLFWDAAYHQSWWPI